MVRKIVNLFVFFSILIVGIQSVSALETFVGVKILNLTDDPAHSCAGEDGYGSQGRIRAISSIPPEFPIYFELRRISDDTIIWSGNTTEDSDYGIGDIIYIPAVVNLTIGENYELFFDIDAIKIYIHSDNYYDLHSGYYWTVGKIGSGSSKEHYYYRSTSFVPVCLTGRMGDLSQSGIFFVSKDRDASKLIHSCMTDSTEYNCNSLGIYGFRRYNDDYDINIDGQYNNLYLPDVGNFYVTFTFY